MASRKTVSNLSPPAARATISPSTGMSSEYSEALKTLDESVMRQVCESLSKDDGAEDAEPLDDLLEVYYKCETAWKVIKKQQRTYGVPGTSAPLMPRAAPNLMSLAPQLGAAAPSMARRGSLSSMPTKKSTHSKEGVIPLRRTAAMMKPPSAAAAAINKKARTNFPGDPPQVVDANPQAPPPAALNFLARLNHDVDNSASDSGEESSASKSTSSSAVKRNPPRGQHRKSPSS